MVQTGQPGSSGSVYQEMQVAVQETPSVGFSSLVMRDFMYAAEGQENISWFIPGHWEDPYSPSFHYNLNIFLIEFINYSFMFFLILFSPSMETSHLKAVAFPSAPSLKSCILFSVIKIEE